MLEKDIQVFSEIGRALWVNPERSQRRAMETLEVTSYVESSRELWLERASAALLQRAIAEGMAANADAGFAHFQSPFYRLSTQERFVLVALHRGHWSYGRLSRVTAESVERIQEIAWRARIALATKPYPVGSAAQGARCPDYIPSRPWTQKFLDDEVQSGQERLFLQNHLMACQDCRAAFLRCKDLYYDVDAAVSSVGVGTDLDQGHVRAIEKRMQKTARLRSPLDRTFMDSLVIFSGRRDVRIVLAGIVLLFVVKILRLLSLR